MKISPGNGMANLYLHGSRLLIACVGHSEIFAGSKSGCVDGPRLQAQFCNPQGLAINQEDGSIYVADCGNKIIRKISNDGM